MGWGGTWGKWVEMEDVSGSPMGKWCKIYLTPAVSGTLVWAKRRKKFWVEKNLLEKCGATINNHCHPPIFPHFPPFFLVAKFGEMGRLSPNMPQQKVHFWGFGPRISYFSIRTSPKKKLILPHLPPLSLFFPISRIVYS